MHDAGCTNNFSAVGGADALVSQADAKNGNLSAKSPDHVAGYSGFFGRAGSGRDNDLLGPDLLNLLQGNLIVPEDLDRGSQLSKIVKEVVGEGVVVID